VKSLLSSICCSLEFLSVKYWIRCFWSFHTSSSISLSILV